jgi:hypothetical protein
MDKGKDDKTEGHSESQSTGQGLRTKLAACHNWSVRHKDEIDIYVKLLGIPAAVASLILLVCQLSVTNDQNKAISEQNRSVAEQNLSMWLSNRPELLLEPPVFEGPADTSLSDSTKGEISLPFRNVGNSLAAVESLIVEVSGCSPLRRNMRSYELPRTDRFRQPIELSLPGRGPWGVRVRAFYRWAPLVQPTGKFVLDRNFRLSLESGKLRLELYFPTDNVVAGGSLSEIK